MKKFWSSQRKLEKQHLLRFLKVAAIIYIFVAIAVEVVSSNKYRSCWDRVEQLDESYRKALGNSIPDRSHTEFIGMALGRCIQSRTQAKIFTYTGLLPVVFLGYFVFRWVFNYIFPKK